MKFSLRSVFIVVLLCAVSIWLVNIRAKELQRAISLERNNYITVDDAHESVRKRIGSAINKMGHRDGLTIANASIHFFEGHQGQIALHCVGWHPSDLFKAELSNGHSVTETRLIPLEQYDDGVLFVFSGNVQEEFVTPETSNFEEIRIRLINSKNQVFTEWFPVWVWKSSGNREHLIHQPPEHY